MKLFKKREGQNESLLRKMREYDNKSKGKGQKPVKQDKKPTPPTKHKTLQII